MEINGKGNKFWRSIKRACIAITILIVIAGCFAIPRIIDGLTPVDELTNKYLKRDYKELCCFSSINADNLSNYFHENSIYKNDGAVCNDGWVSTSTGQGTCSWHGGVRHWYHKGEYGKTLEECQQEATKKIEEYRQKAIKNSWRQ